jgi:hypothetical protein
MVPHPLASSPQMSRKTAADVARTVHPCGERASRTRSLSKKLPRLMRLEKTQMEKPTIPVTGTGTLKSVRWKLCKFFHKDTKGRWCCSLKVLKSAERH